MAESKTVDNLGPDVHTRYIQDIRLLSEEEVKKIQPGIAITAEILEIVPKFDNIDILWGTHEQESTLFEKPKNFVLATNIFTNSIIPSLGPEHEIIQKLKLLKKSKDSGVERQRQNLLQFAIILKNLNIILTDIKNKKEEFHKG